MRRFPAVESAIVVARRASKFMKLLVLLCFLNLRYESSSNLEKRVLIAKILSALINLLNAHPHMDLLHVSRHPGHPTPLLSQFLVLTATQVSSRELAGKPLQGYEKRNITYEVHNTHLANLFIADIYPTKNLSHEDVRKVCSLLAHCSKMT